MTARKRMTKAKAEALLGRKKGSFGGAVASLMALLVAENANAREGEAASNLASDAEAQMAALADLPMQLEEVAAATEGEIAQVEQAAADLEAADELAEAAKGNQEDSEQVTEQIKAVTKKMAVAEEAEASGEKIILADAGAAASTVETATDAGAAAGAGAAEVTLGAIPLVPLGAIAAAGVASIAGSKGTSSSTSETQNVTIVDGYVKGAKVGWDTNNDGKVDIYATGTTNDKGQITIQKGQAGWRLVSEEGTDALTGKVVGKMIAANGATVVTPLTTLLAVGGLTEAQLKAKLGIDSSISLKDYDPIKVMQTGTAAQKAAALKVFEVSQEVMTVIQSAAAAKASTTDHSLDLADVSDIAKAIAASIAASNGSTVAAVMSGAVHDALVSSGLTGTALTTLENATVNATQAISLQITAKGDELIAAIASGNTATITADLTAVTTAQQLDDLVLASDTKSLSILNMLATSVDTFQSVASSSGTGSLGTGPIHFDLTDAQAAIASAIDGATGTLHAGSGTQLQTSLKQMQKLGIDSVVPVAAGAEMHINYGDGDLVAGFGGGALPVFNTADSVTIEFTDAQIPGLQRAELEALQAAHVDSIGAVDHTLSITQSLMNGLYNHNLTFDAHDDVTVALTGGALTDSVVKAVVTTHVDIINLQSNTGSLTEAQAVDLVNAGVHFAADDNHVTLNVEVGNVPVEGTHLSTSIKQMAHLGVDMVAATVVSGAPAELHVQYGAGDIDAKIGIPHFNDAANVIVEFTDSQLAGLKANDAFVHQLVDAGVDYIGATSGNMTFDVNTVTALMDAGLKGFDAHDTVTVVATDQELAGLLSSPEDVMDAGMNVHVDVIHMADSTATITEADALALITAGMQFAEADTVTLQGQPSGHGTYLNNLSLKDLGKLGVDSYQTAAGTDHVGVKVGVDLSAMSEGDLNKALAELLGKFHPTEVTSTNHVELFQAEDHVVLNLGNVNLDQVSAAVLHEAKLIGIDDLKADDGLGHIVTKHTT